MIKLEDLEPGSGQRHAKIALQKNGNPPPEFIFGDTYFGVIIRGKQT